MSDTSTNTGRYQATFAKLKAEGRGAFVPFVTLRLAKIQTQ